MKRLKGFDVFFQFEKVFEVINKFQKLLKPSRIFKVFINKQPEYSTITKNAFLVKEPTILKIQPNPFYKEISIELNNNNTKSITLKLFSGNNKLLKEIYSGKEPKKVITINTEAYAKGLYYLELRAENFRKIYRVIKQ